MSYSILPTGHLTVRASLLGVHWLTVGLTLANLALNVLAVVIMVRGLFAAPGHEVMGGW